MRIRRSSRHSKRSLGRATVQIIAVSVAAIAGGSITMPMVMKSMTSPPAASQPETTAGSPMSSPANAGVAKDGPSASASAQLSASAQSSGSVPTSAATSDVTSNSMLAKETVYPALTIPSITKVEVFYATDRGLVLPTDMHLWLTTLVPSILCTTIALVLIAYAYFHSGVRRWVFAGISCVAVLITAIVLQKAAVQGGQLMRLASNDDAWFATQRFEASDGDYPLHLGRSMVTMPPNHQSGEFERPSIFRLEISEREDKHIVIQRIEPIEKESFFNQLKQRVEVTEHESALVFIHGYNVSFEDALRRTAQMSFDIGYSGVPITYSWPSKGKFSLYLRDEGNVAWTVTHLEQFLSDVKERTGVKRFHLVAHSMGNRALMGALERLTLRFPGEQPMFDQVVMAAPDVDADEFRDRYAQAVTKSAIQATLYASSTDRALLASMKLHGYRRLGLTSSPQPTIHGVDLVDVTPFDTSLLGHSYYGSLPMMIRDLKEIIGVGSKPSSRKWLAAIDSRDPPLWHFAPTTIANSEPLLVR